MALGNVLDGWKPSGPQRSPEDEAIYDKCLIMQSGNKVTCDAMMRTLDRERIAEKAMLEEAARMLAAGASKRDVVNWAAEHGFVGSQLSRAVGISLQDLQSGNY